MLIRLLKSSSYYSDILNRWVKDNGSGDWFRIVRIYNNGWYAVRPLADRLPFEAYGTCEDYALVHTSEIDWFAKK